jgi:hypothetical protein
MTSTTALTEVPDFPDFDELLAERPPLLSVVPVAGPPVFVFAGFGVVLLLLLVPPLTLLATLVGVALLAAAAVVALVVLIGAMVAAPFVLVHRLREHPLPHLSLPVSSLGKLKVRRV